jgi:hypothetical protein
MGEKGGSDGGGWKMDEVEVEGGKAVGARRLAVYQT